jgi:lactoylglutathione lyase
MKLGAFSVSLAVKDIHASLAFYGKLGFEPFHGDAAQGWLILRNAEGVVVGLFQGMFSGNLLTFNPGWDPAAQNVDPFDDVREIQSRLEAQGLVLTTRADAGTNGPASLTLTDPDGNVILIDQHR